MKRIVRSVLLAALVFGAASPASAQTSSGAAPPAACGCDSLLSTLRGDLRGVIVRLQALEGKGAIPPARVDTRETTFEAKVRNTLAELQQLNRDRRAEIAVLQRDGEAWRRADHDLGDKVDRGMNDRRSELAALSGIVVAQRSATHDVDAKADRIAADLLRAIGDLTRRVDDLQGRLTLVERKR